MELVSRTNRKGKIWLKRQRKQKLSLKNLVMSVKKALDDALKLIEKDFGKGAVMRLGERAEQKSSSHEFR